MIRRSGVRGERGKAGRPFIIGVALGAALAAPTTAQDMQAYLTETRAMVSQGRYEDALERLIWFHEHALEHQPSMAGVRLSFALSYWEDLGQLYPPAMWALVEMRDSTRARLLAAPAERQLLQDLQGLNRVLDQQPATLEVFDRIAAEYPEAAATQWSVVQRLAVEQDRLDLLRTYRADLLGQFEQERRMYEYNMSSDSVRPALAARLRSLTETRFVSESLRLIVTALALGQDSVAKEIQTRALTLVPNERIRSAVP